MRFNRELLTMPQLTENEINQFNRDGYLMRKALFDAEEMDLLIKIGKTDQRLEREALQRKDANATTSKLWLTDVLEDDIYSAFVRCLRIVEPMEQLLGGEVYHYHHKMMLKEPFVGGSWEWHQDYGYWYSNTLLVSIHGKLPDRCRQGDKRERLSASDKRLASDGPN